MPAFQNHVIGPKAVDVVRSHTERLASCTDAEHRPPMCACDGQPDCDFVAFLNHVFYGYLQIRHGLANEPNEVLETLSPLALTRVRLMRYPVRNKNAVERAEIAIERLITRRVVVCEE